MSLWQTHQWQKMLKKSGQIEEFFEVQPPPHLPLGEGGTIFAEKRQVALGEFGLFILGLPSAKISEQLSQELRNLCKRENCLFVQIETLDYTSTIQEIPLYRGMKQGKYYKKFIPPHTAIINLTQSEEQILSLMKPKGRYNIRLAEKKGVVVEQVEKNPYHTQIFYTLMQETTKRDDFAGNSLHYYETFLREIEDSQLFFAYFEKQVIAAGIFVTNEDALLYYYGASSSEYRNLMAPYLLQWTAIIHAKKRGCKMYDFLGIASPGEKKSPLAGVTDFKLKFTADTRRVSEAYIFVNKKWKYFFIVLLKKMRKR